MTDSRGRILQAAQDLFWRYGVSGTSPRAVLARSGVGQGSLYHHFPTKTALARATLASTVDQALASTTRDLRAGPALESLRSYLTKERDGLAGCRVGRHAAEASVVEDDELRQELRRYFEFLHRAVEGRARELAKSSDPVPVEPSELADTIVATVQGAYVVARATNDQTHMDRAVVGLATLLEMAFTTR